MGRILSEFLGTFLLVACTLIGSREAAAFAFAAGLWALSAQPTGGFNPALTLSLAVRGRLRPKWAFAFAGTQLLAALSAAVVTALLVGHNPERLSGELPGPVPDAWFACLFTETAGTAALGLLVLVAFSARRTAGSALAPLMVGLGFLAIREAFASWSSFMNPALLLAWGFHDVVSSLRSSTPGEAIPAEALRFGAFLPWAALVIAAQLTGALLANLLFRLTHPADRD